MSLICCLFNFVVLWAFGCWFVIVAFLSVFLLDVSLVVGFQGWRGCFFLFEVFFSLCFFLFVFFGCLDVFG